MTGENKPVHVVRAGGVSAAIWKNVIKRDGRDVEVYSVQIERTYKQGTEWRRTNSFSANDLPKVQLVAAKAFEHLSLKEPAAENGS